MIIEMRTYTLQPGSLAEVEKRFGASLPVPREALQARRLLAHRGRAAEPDHPCLGL
jgi:hypothetical protein